MGVKGLRNIIQIYAANSIKKREFKYYRGTIQSLDAPITLYRFCIAIMNTENFKMANGEITGHLFACFFKSLAMLRYGIMPLWVFDGVPPILKQSTLNERRKIKENALNKMNDESLNTDEKHKLAKRIFTVSSKHITEIKHLLKLLGLPYTEAPGEAEAQCAALDFADVSDGVVTEDWDAILFGCTKMLKDFSNKSYVTEIDVPELLKSLEMTREQLIDLCAILGNDYCNGINGLKPIEAYEKFKKCKFDMNVLLGYLKNENKINNNHKYKIPENFEEQWFIAREYYLHAPVIDPRVIKVVWNKPNYKELYEYLIEVKKFKKDIIITKLNELELMYNKYLLNGNELITLSRIKKELNIYPLQNFMRNKTMYPNSTTNISIINNPNQPIDYFLELIGKTILVIN